MSTRADGGGSAVVRVSAKAELGAGGYAMRLTVTDLGDGLWKYSLSGPGVSQAGYGRVTAHDHLIALRCAARVLAGGFRPGTAQRGLLEALAEGT